MDQIIIKQNYFDNIKTAVNGINQFFETEFKTKNFPVDIVELDWSIANIIELLNDLDPAYVSDNKKLDSTLDMISDTLNDAGSISTQQILANRPVRNALQSIVSYSALVDISNNFDAFNKFVNGIYTFDLFMKPSQYRNEIMKFCANLILPEEIEDIDLETSIFDVDMYVTNLFNNPDITFPPTMNVDSEIERILAFKDVQNTEVVIDDKPEEETQSVQSSEIPTETTNTETNPTPVEPQTPPVTNEAYYDESSKPTATFPCENVRYSSKYQVSSQYKSEVDTIISNLKKCNDVSDVKDYMDHFRMPDAIDIPFPYIIVKALSHRLDEEEFNTLRLEYDNVFKKKASLKSTSRISNYSLYDTFKIDKDATINFLEDYFRLNLVNNPNAVISNKILLSLFNIFDSRVYLLSMYNVHHFDENGNEFVANIRKRINDNSKNVNTYQKSTDKKVPNLSKDTETVEESIVYRLKDYGNITLEEINVCEGFKQLIHDEIELIDNLAYNNGMSKNDIDNFITEESYAVMEASEMFRNRPAARGDIPAYMLSRIDMSDDEPDKIKEPKTVDIPDPIFEEPQNSVDELADSVTEKMGMDGSLPDLIGSGFDEKRVTSDGKIVYNITYNNSFNKSDSHNTSNDLSTNKSISKSNSNNTTTNTQPKNNNDNSNNSLDSKEFEEHVTFYGDRKFSNGLTVAEMFMLFESEEPLSMEAVTIDAGKPPTADSLTKAMDKDRESLAKTQEVKKKVQKFGNTIRAKAKPISRVKQWLTNVVNSLIERDETRVKEEIIENPSYRSSLYKALRLAVKFGLTGLAFTVSSYLGTAVVALELAKFGDKQRLRREVQDEMVTELKVLDEKMEYAKKKNNQQELYRLMRIRGRLQGIAADASRGRWNTVHPQRKWY